MLCINIPCQSLSHPLQEFKGHGRSREAVEMAFDEILKQKMKVRHKYGFKPPKSGKRTDVEGDPTVRFLFINTCIRLGGMPFVCAVVAAVHEQLSEWLQIHDAAVTLFQYSCLCAFQSSFERSSPYTVDLMQRRTFVLMLPCMSTAQNHGYCDMKVQVRRR